MSYSLHVCGMKKKSNSDFKNYSEHSFMTDQLQWNVLNQNNEISASGFSSLCFQREETAEMLTLLCPGSSWVLSSLDSLPEFQEMQI